MAYETGTATGPTNLVTKLLLFAAANGWTAGTATTGNVLSKGGIVCGIFADATTIQLRGAIGVNLGVAWNAQTNNAGFTSSCNVGAGPFSAYHFYSDSEASAERLYAVIEVAAGIFRHILICSLVKIGTWTGGTYIATTFHSLAGTQIDAKDASQHTYLADSIAASNNHLWCDADGRTNSWSLSDGNLSLVQRFLGNYRVSGLGYNAFVVGHARYSLRTVLGPLMLFQTRPSSLRSLAGYVPNLRSVNMELYPVGFQDNIGGDDWDVWPNTLRTDNNGSIGSTTPSSGWYGYASKHVA